MTFIPRSTYNRRIVDCVAEEFGVSRAEIFARTKVPQIVRARYAIMYTMKNARGYSSKQIGRFLDRDHSTVINGWQRVEADPDLKAQCERVAAEYMDIPTFSDRNFYL